VKEITALFGGTTATSKNDMSSSRVVYTIPDSPTVESLSSPGVPSSPPLPPLYPVTGTSSNRSLPHLPTDVNHPSKPAHHRSQSSQTLPHTQPGVGTTSNNPIDLTSSPPRPNLPPPPPPPPPRVDARSGPVATGTSSSTERPTGRRRGSGYLTATLVPDWQPDHIVKACPICKGQFGLFYRKHHCRYVLAPIAVGSNTVLLVCFNMNVFSEHIQTCAVCLPFRFTTFQNMREGCLRKLLASSNHSA
jgi:hypothetical protein